MKLSTIINLPGHIDPTRTAWSGTLAEALRWDGDRMTQDAEARGIPVDADGEVDWPAVTIEHVRIMCDDPNASVAG